MKKLFGYVIAYSAILITVSGCAIATGASDPPFCQTYEPVYTSPLDTAETQRQTDRNNSVHMELC